MIGDRSGDIEFSWLFRDLELTQFVGLSIVMARNHSVLLEF